ncbi:hypothetical protein D3C75_882280 [compost metagenome]
MGPFAQGFRITVHEGNFVGAKGGGGHQKPQHGACIAYIQLLHPGRMGAEAVYHQLGLILGQGSPQVPDTTAHRIAVLAVGRIIDGACPFRQRADQKIAGGVVLR